MPECQQRPCGASRQRAEARLHLDCDVSSERPSEGRGTWSSRLSPEPSFPVRPSMPSGRSPYIAGGEVRAPPAPSIWRPADAQGKPRVNLPTENGKFPETKHTMM